MRKIGIISIGIIMLFCVGLVIPSLDEHQDFFEDNHSRNAFQIAENLRILSNEDWEIQGWPGNGTVISPFLVENMSLDDMRIENSDVFFLIRNCTCVCVANITLTTNGEIEESTFNNLLSIDSCSDLMISNVTFEDSSGDQNSNILDIISSENIVVENCIIRDSINYGLNIEESTNCTLRGNVFSNCGIQYQIRYIMALKTSVPQIQTASFDVSQDSYASGGALSIKNCSTCVISNNTISNNIGHAIHSIYSDNLEITSNFEEYNGGEASFYSCQENNLVDNTFNSGLALWTCAACILTGNKIGSSGLSLKGLHGLLSDFLHNLTNNTVHSKPLLYLVNESDTTYSNAEYGQIFVINSDRISLSQVDVDASFPSINIIYSPLCVISEAVCSSIDIYYSANSEIHKSVITGGFTGIECRISPECQINNNTIRDTIYGIRIHSNSFESLIHNNKVIDVSKDGIHIESSYCIIENNTISGCAIPVEEPLMGFTWKYAGITIWSEYCLIRNNTVISNHCYGIWVALYGSNNTLYLNHLSENTLGNGVSDGEDNQWDNGSDTGNYWGNWLGFGPYIVPGNEGCVDRFPTGPVNITIQVTVLVILLAIGGSAIIIVIMRRFRNQPI